MARKGGRIAGGAVVIEKASVSLAEWTKAADERLNEAIVDTKARRVVDEVNPDGPKAVTKHEAPSDAWARDEVDVIRRLAKGPARLTGNVGEYGGELGRSLERRALGTGSAPSSSKAYEPSTYSPHHVAAERVWFTMTEFERVMLARMYAGEHSAKSVAGRVKVHMREGAILAARAEIKAFDSGIDSGLMDLHRVTPTQLLAIRLGLLAVDAPHEELERVTSNVGKRLGQIRHKFRERLYAVDLNAAIDGQKDMRSVLEKKPFILPRKTLAETKRTERVVVCASRFSIVDGVRPPCVAVSIEDDVRAWPKCATCGRPSGFNEQVHRLMEE